MRAVKDATGIVIAPLDTTFDTYTATLEDGSQVEALAPMTAEDPRGRAGAARPKRGPCRADVDVRQQPLLHPDQRHVGVLDHCYYKYKLANDGSSSYDWYALQRYGTAHATRRGCSTSGQIRAYRSGGSSQSWADWNPRVNWYGGSCSTTSIGISTPVGGISKSFERCPDQVTFSKSANRNPTGLHANVVRLGDARQPRGELRDRRAGHPGRNRVLRDAGRCPGEPVLGMTRRPSHPPGGPSRGVPLGRPPAGRSPRSRRQGSLTSRRTRSGRRFRRCAIGDGNCGHLECREDAVPPDPPTIVRDRTVPTSSEQTSGASSSSCAGPTATAITTTRRCWSSTMATGSARSTPSTGEDEDRRPTGERAFAPVTCWPGFDHPTGPRWCCSHATQTGHAFHYGGRQLAMRSVEGVPTLPLLALRPRLASPQLPPAESRRSQPARARILISGG